ncbi:MAG: YfhO family protein, partial [Dehalococcoidia bacterium]|nr:YfhO family protein [Dehalococcoidia bacterium]
ESSTQNPNTGPRPLSPVPRQAAVFAVCGLVALGVSAIQLIPSFELSQLSVRAEINYATSVQYSLSPAQLVSLFVPGFFGRGPLDYWGPWVRTEMGYAGVLTLVAGLVAIVLRRQRETLFFLLLAIVSLSLSLGGHSLTQGWLYSVGAGFDKLRAPARFLFLFDFALAALAGLGIDQMLRPLTHGEKMSLRGIARYVTFFAVVVAAGALPPFLYFLFDTIGAGGGPTVARLTGIVEGIALFLLLLAGCVALLWARVKDWIGPAVLGGLAVAWMGFDLMTTGFNVEVGTKDPTGNFQHPGVINFLKQDKSLYRVDSVTDVWDVWQPDTTLLNGIPDIWGVYNPMISADLDNYWAKLGSRSSPLYDLMNAKYLIGHKGVPLAKKFELVYDDDPQVSVFRNSKALPRAFVVYSADVISDKDQAFEAIHDKTFDPTQKVIVEGGQPITSTILNSSVVFTAYSANEMVIKASAAAPAYLVLSEVYNDGWKAIVDGQPQKILRADYLFRAIPLPAGDHEVRLVFDPTSFRQGATLTGLTWAVLAGATGIGLLRRRQRPKSRQNLP